MGVSHAHKPGAAGVGERAGQGPGTRARAKCQDIGGLNFVLNEFIKPGFRPQLKS